MCSIWLKPKEISDETYCVPCTVWPFLCCFFPHIFHYLFLWAGQTIATALGVNLVSFTQLNLSRLYLISLTGRVCSYWPAMVACGPTNTDWNLSHDIRNTLSIHSVLPWKATAFNTDQQAIQHPENPSCWSTSGLTKVSIQRYCR